MKQDDRITLCASGIINVKSLSRADRLIRLKTFGHEL